MSDQILKECEAKMLKTIEAVKDKFTGIRAGRANISMLDMVKVDSYGSEVPLNQVGTVSAPEARLLVIDPWDKSMIPKIEKAILASNVGMTPNNDGRVIRLVLPELTADRRKEYVKLAKSEAENGKVAVRNIRKDVNAQLKKLEKDKENPMSEDDLKVAEGKVQVLTDKYVKEIDELLAKKEKEITTI
ncbi:MAG: ribosome recycling factor [Fusobacterium gastrosuis]|uniref:ribosome recycling factor n=1 Tax=Fusobacterium TaxID=848 RepID=UPI001F4F4C5E|nr:MULTISPECIES: ribosome recycling factor [Fusobacterium]MDD7392274.1 ribosome recycling factor [Fusobacteriaceae bacterium]MCI5724928.1 ribosome recycling factor [Fusobacterium sp.]MCI7224224.1 ribosome recycling factor [Fusobacterium sp.]MDD7409730.1 ribosome recycling factor [Fusobacteriaceae bacterium]MDY4012028.1 ribosome recycling factor [Fusobacterium gastrosuis]